MNKVKTVLLAAGVSLAFTFISCSGGAKSKDSDSGQEVSSTDLYKVLDGTSCPNASDFRGTGVGSDENEALAQARSSMALEHFSQKLKSNVNISGQNIVNAD